MKIYCGSNREITLDRLIGQDVWVLVKSTVYSGTKVVDFYCKVLGKSGDSYNVLEVASYILDDANTAEFLTDSEWNVCATQIFGKSFKRTADEITIVTPLECYSTEEIAERVSENIPSLKASNIVNLVRGAV